MKKRLSFKNYLWPALLVVAFAVGIFAATYLLNSRHEFMSDDVLLQGTMKDGKPFLLNVEINRDQQARNTYLNYSYLDLKVGDKSFHDETNSIKTSAEISSSGYYSNWQNKISTDLSSRETLSFDISQKDMKISVSASDLNGDFITKNRPEYTRYYSIGSALVTINGETIQANAMLGKIYSSDSRKVLLSTNGNLFKGSTDYLAFWDDLNNFYLIDKTVLTENKAPEKYADHTWVLYKDREDNTSQKFFDADVVTVKKSDKPDSWQVTIPGLSDRRIELSAKTFLSQRYSGYMEGTVTYGLSESMLRGYFVRVD
jgi:hypothetical protein